MNLQCPSNGQQRRFDAARANPSTTMHFWTEPPSFDPALCRDCCSMIKGDSAFPLETRCYFPILHEDSRGGLDESSLRESLDQLYLRVSFVPAFSEICAHSSKGFSLAQVAVPWLPAMFVVVRLTGRLTFGEDPACNLRVPGEYLRSYLFLWAP